MSYFLTMSSPSGIGINAVNNGNVLDTILTILRYGVGTLLIFAGLLIIILAIIGIFRLNYVLNRMHVAATCDTLGMLLILVGLVFFEGITFTTLKLVLIVIFFWISSPICSHLIDKIESQTNKNIKDECEEMEL